MDCPNCAVMREALKMAENLLFDEGAIDRIRAILATDAGAKAAAVLGAAKTWANVKRGDTRISDWQRRKSDAASALYEAVAALEKGADHAE